MTVAQCAFRPAEDDTSQAAFSSLSLHVSTVLISLLGVYLTTTDNIIDNPHHTLSYLI